MEVIRLTSNEAVHNISYTFSRYRMGRVHCDLLYDIWLALFSGIFLSPACLKHLPKLISHQKWETIYSIGKPLRHCVPPPLPPPARGGVWENLGTTVHIIPPARGGVWENLGTTVHIIPPARGGIWGN